MAAGDRWTAQQRDVVIVTFLGWMLDAFDFFLLIFVLSRLAHDFHTDVKTVALATTLTLAMRPIGAFIFGRFADLRGRRPALMLCVLLYSVIEFASAFAPTLTVLLILRALFGIAMGGEWGVGASLAFETIPVRSRGIVSGILQAGYPCGYLIAAVVFGLLFDRIGWRGMFMLGIAPALLVVYIFARVPESPVWLASRGDRSHGQKNPGLFEQLKGYWGLVLFGALLMTAFNFFSHGTQDLYPTYLGQQRGFSTGTVSWIAIVYNVGALTGGIVFGRLSSRIGRRRAIALAALLALPALPFWAFSVTPVAIAAAAFVMQFMVQGAWGVVPVHLNELAPARLRATFPGFVYTLGNLVASSNAPLQAWVAERHGSVSHPDYAFALALFAAIVALAVAGLATLGPERRDVSFTIAEGT